MGSSNGESVIAYHGTAIRKADRIRAEGFRPSDNPYDWLGDGVYFWERGPGRAWQWACDLYGTADACVVKARVPLADCLDLTDIDGVELLRPFYDRFYAARGEQVVRALRQRGGARRVDSAVINFAIDTLEEDGLTISVVRAAFPEGEPLWRPPDMDPSGLLDRTHVQLAVRNPSIVEVLDVQRDR